MAEQGLRPPAQRRVRAECLEQVEADHGRWQHQRQRHDSLRQTPPRDAAHRERAPEPNGDRQQKGEGSKAELDRKPERVPVHSALLAGQHEAVATHHFARSRLLHVGIEAFRH